jgi:peroxidase
MNKNRFICCLIFILSHGHIFTQSGGKPYHVPLGRLDSLEPASWSSVNEIPLHSFNVDQLIASFSSRNLDERDLVVLSGAHTIGGARCTSIASRFPEDTEFVRRMRINCTNSDDANMLQDLDVTTPSELDNKYHQNLLNGTGVLTSDVQLLLNDATLGYVNNFADNEWHFWNQFANSMTKMGMLRGPQGNVGHVRYSCGSSLVPAA